MDRIALQILEDSWKHDARVMQRATDTLQLRLQEQTDGRWAAAAFEINRIYNIIKKHSSGSARRLKITLKSQVGITTA
ncbi:MAG: hypothetical protein O2946_06390 [Planctomycetota bacterium]|nr:hypothetical protein [Planctomycetota bacterium]